MYKEYFFEDVETILGSDTEIPKSVEERIQDLFYIAKNTFMYFGGTVQPSVPAGSHIISDANTILILQMKLK